MELKNGQGIQVHLETTIHQEGESQQFIFDAPGQLIQMGNTLYIRYHETTSGKEKKEPIPVTIKIQPEGNVQIMRGEKKHTRLKFSYEKKVPISYATPQGVFSIESYTPYLHFSLKDQPLHGQLDLHYALYAKENLLGMYELQLTFSV